MNKTEQQPPAPSQPQLPDFSGKWVLDRTEQLEEYMKQSLGLQAAKYPIIIFRLKQSLGLQVAKYPIILFRLNQSLGLQTAKYPIILFRLKQSLGLQIAKYPIIMFRLKLDRDESLIDNGRSNLWTYHNRQSNFC